jgi:hypothetical protein
MASAANAPELQTAASDAPVALSEGMAYTDLRKAVLVDDIRALKVTSHRRRRIPQESKESRCRTQARSGVTGCRVQQECVYLH